MMGNVESMVGRIGMGAEFALASLIVAVFVLVAPAAVADGITFVEEPVAIEAGAEPVEQEAGGACPELVQIKYPWLSCSTDEWGNTSLDRTGDAGPVSRVLLLDATGSPGGDPLWGLNASQIY